MAADHEQRVLGAQQVLTFTLGEAIYGIDISQVQEIRAWTAVTPLPRSPPHLPGVLNLRGAVLPVLDLRLCFGIREPQYCALTVIIVLSVTCGNSARCAGIVVDSVEDVIAVAAGDVHTAPHAGLPAAGRCVRGLLAHAGRTLVLLDIEKLLTEQMPRGAAHRAA